MSSSPMNQVMHQLRTMVSRDGQDGTDGDLLEAFVRHRDEAALEALLRRHSGMVWGVCRRVLANHHDVEEAFQATFLVLVRKASSIRPRHKVGNWLYGVAQQTALKTRARSGKRQAREKQVSVMPEPAATATEPDSDLGRILDQELSRLPDKYRSVLVLCELEGRAIKEAARQLGIPDGTVASRLARGRTLLAKRLAPHKVAISATTLPALLAQQASATVPATVLTTTIKAVCSFATGKGLGLVSAGATAICEEVVQAMFLTKFAKISTVLFLVLAACGIGWGAYTNLGNGAKEDPVPALGTRKEAEPIALAPIRPEPGPKEKSPEPDRAKLKILDLRFKQLKDDDLPQLPQDIDGLLMRGGLGYGSNSVTDDGMKHLTRFTKLRILAAGGLALKDRSLETIGKLTNLEELSLDSNKITGEGLRYLTGLKKLRRLDLNYNQIDAEALKWLAELPELTYLGINDIRPVNDRLLELCSRLGQMRELLLWERTEAVTDVGLKHLAKLGRLENLTLIGSPKITDAGMTAIAGMRQLKHVRLQELPKVTADGMKALGKLPELRTLQVVSIRMDEGSLHALGSLTKLEELTLWSISHKPGASLEGLGELPSLRRFRTNMSVSSAFLRVLARSPNLESIGDELYEVSDEDLTHLAKLPKLKSLILASDKVTAASLPTLAKMKSLRSLYVTDKVGITPEQWAMLGRDSLPSCTITNYRPPYTVYHKGAE